MIVSAEKDIYSSDAKLILDDIPGVDHLRTPGGHALDDERHKAIASWIASH